MSTVASVVAESLRAGEQAGLAGDDRAAVAADVGGHGRRAARGSLGEREPPALGERCAEHDPRPSVLVEELVGGRPPGDVDPARRIVVGDPALQLVAQRAVADQPDPQIRDGSARRRGGLERQLEPLHRGEPADDDHVGSRSTSVPPGEKNGSTPLGTAVTRSGRKPSSISSSRVDSDGVTIAPRR